MKRLALTLVLLLLPLAPAPAGAGEVPAGDPVQRHSVTVTLVTGDRVTLTRAGDQTPRVSVVPARKPGRVATFHTTMAGGSVRVVPSDVAHLVPGVLDPRLFDVMAVAEVSTPDSVPVIVRGTAGTRWRSARQLPSINAVAVALSPPEAMALTGDLLAAGSGGQRIWLDSRVRADRLSSAKPKWDNNLAQIGAPAAWAAGLSGAGVSVAVLDTGVDATHPDLAGRVAQAQNFTSGPDAIDRNGHGTHVASLLAGSGAASTATPAGDSGAVPAGGGTSTGGDGGAIAAGGISGGNSDAVPTGGGTSTGGVPGDGEQAGDGVMVTGTHRAARRGVAFGATLLVGKVLDDDGAGSFSDIIAGMEWAAQRARIVNMSLGSDFASSGNDPLSLAVQALTQAHGTLFVASAGNRGPGSASIGTPGAADAALTVGAVDSRDRLAAFSSRGPRAGDYGMKPDIVAPGVGIIGARAAGTDLGEPVGERYTRLSGTSMAAPQAAGAAALLAQLHPEWTGGEIKALLVGSAHPVAAGAFEAGSGRVDLARALPQAVIAPQPSVGFGFAAYPQAGLPPVSRAVTLANKGAVPVTLDLAVQGVSFGVTPARVTLPAGGQVTATVTAAVDVGPFGAVSGVLAAGREVRVPLGLVREEVHHHVKIRAVDRLGASGQIETLAWLMNLQDITKSPPDPVLLTQGEGTVRVRPGAYLVTAAIPTIEEGEPDPEDDPVVTSVSIATEAEVMVSGDAEIVLDARQARPPTASVAGHQTVPVDLQVFVAATDKAGNNSVLAYATSAQDVVEGKLFIQPTTRPRHGDVELSSKWRLDTVGGGSTYDLLFADRVFPTSLEYVVDARSLAQVRTTYRVPASPAGYTEGRFVHTPLNPVSVAIFQPAPAAPAQRVEWLSPGTQQEWFQCANVLVAQEGLGGYCQAPATYRRGQSSDRDWLRAPLRTRAAVSFSRTRLFIGMDDLADDAGNAGSLASYVFPDRSFSLYRDNVLIAQGADPLGGHPVASGPATFRLTRSLRLRPGLFALATEVNTSWTFGLPPPRQTQAALVDVAVHVPVDEANHVSAGSTMTVEVTHPAGRLAGVSLQVSTDDGKTWQPVGLRPAGASRYHATLPPGAGPVSLRTKASDVTGAMTEQTILRAFILNPPG